MEYTSPRMGFEFTTLVVIGTDCTGSCKSNYHTINAMTPSVTFVEAINLIQISLKKENNF